MKRTCMNFLNKWLKFDCKEVCHKIFDSAANGLPIAAEVQEKYLKVLFSDVGLCSSLLGLSIDQLSVIKDYYTN
jgi:hypothetical protein